MHRPSCLPALLVTLGMYASLAAAQGTGSVTARPPARTAIDPQQADRGGCVPAREVDAGALLQEAFDFSWLTVFSDGSAAYSAEFEGKLFA